MTVAASQSTPASAGKLRSAQALGAQVAAWVPDRGHGTYQNPVLFADYSDPDVVRVGNDFWMTASSFSHVPGLPILHSRDLVNWTLVNHALPYLVPRDHFSTPRHGGGVWAPSIRHHDGRFWIYYPDPDFGLYVVTAKDPRGAWSEPVLVRGGRGLIDPCPLWDTDGQVYLVHGWAKSRAGVCNRVTLHRLSPDGLRTIDDGEVIIDADRLPGWHTLEGPKVYRRGDWYYVFAPAGGVATGVQTVFRSRSIRGPYEPRIVLEQGSTAINGPHQGAWVDTPAGEDWFLHFQDRGPYGRIVHLQPMRWDADAWPRMGTVGAGDIGQPVLQHPKPAGCDAALAVPATSDAFDGPNLGLQWQWQANPGDSWATLSRSTGLRLRAIPAPSSGSLWDAPHLLMQKFPAPRFTATTHVSVALQTAPDRTGLIVFGYSYAWIGLRRTEAGLSLARATCFAANEGGREVVTWEVPVTATEVWLRVTVEDQAICCFEYSIDGNTFLAAGDPFHAAVSKWVGAKVGLFACAKADSAGPAAYADISTFEIAPA